MKTLNLTINADFLALARATARLADPETAALAAAMAAGTEPLTPANLWALTELIIAASQDEGDILLSDLICYCTSQGVMFDVELINRRHLKGWRKLVAQAKEMVLGVFQGRGTREDTIS
jgi:hypothetical protein